MIYRMVTMIGMALLLITGCTPQKDTGTKDCINLSTPEGLVHAVFQALRNHDSQAYVMLTAHTKEELKVAFENDDFEPTDIQLEEMRQIRISFFDEFIVKVEEQGFDLTGAVIKEIRDLQGGAAKYENYVLVVHDGMSELEIILDDCLLFPRGWLIIDCLRLRE